MSYLLDLEKKKKNLQESPRIEGMDVYCGRIWHFWLAICLEKYKFNSLPLGGSV